MSVAAAFASGPAVGYDGLDASSEGETMAAEESHIGGDGDPDEAAGGTLRSAMLADGQPSFPWWLPLPGVLLTVAWAAYRAAGAEEDGGSVLLETLLWPGLAIFVLTTVTTYFGWRLDLD